MTHQYSNISQSDRSLASPKASALWAKTGSKEEPAIGLSLPQHMSDAAAVAERLWDLWLSPGARERIASTLKISTEQARALACFVAGTHDIGKATPEFSGQLDTHRDENLHVYRNRIEEQGYIFPPDLTPPLHHRCPHSAYSQSILIDWLEKKYGDHQQYAETIASIAGAHHGVPAEYLPDGDGRDIQVLTRLNEPWYRAWDELLSMSLEQTGAHEVLSILMNNGTPIPVSIQFYLTGLVIMADWIASNPEFFPMGAFGKAEQVRRVEQGWAAFGSEKPWAPRVDTRDNAHAVYSSRFDWPKGRNPRPMQEVAVEAARAMAGGGMMCIEAPMGQGKTEAGLIAAEILGQASGRSGLVFAAPTQATSNALFARVRAWAEAAIGSGEGLHTMFLGHSKSSLNPEKRKLRRFQVFDDYAVDHAKSSVAQHKWFSGRKRGLLSTFVVCTIDQVLMMALQSKHVMLRHLGLSSKVVIIDEVHAYDAYMGEYLKEALYWLGQLNAPVILMSATLPSGVREKLFKSYAAGLTTVKRRGKRPTQSRKPQTSPVHVDPAALAYPVIHTLSAADRGVARAWNIPAPQEQARVSVRLIEDDFSVLEEALAPLNSGHGCAAVICNTVGRSQDAYEYLRNRYGEDVVLAHSRFIASHRARQEEELVAALGPAAHRGDAQNPRPERLIVVGTQVIEQSLDLDFDVMVTDFAPVDLVLQRLGRLHRHHRSPDERPAKYHEPICYVRGVETAGSEDTAPEFPQGSRTIYEPAILLSSYAQLMPYFAGKPLRIPADMSPLVQGAYADEPHIPEGWQETYGREKADYLKNLERSRTRAKSYLLARPQTTRTVMADIMGSYINRKDRKLSEDQVGEARVRDTDASLEVIMVLGERDSPKGPLARYRLMPASKDEGTLEYDWHEVDSLEEITYDEAFKFAACSIRLPYQFSDSPKNRIKNNKKILRFDAALDELEEYYISAWQEQFLLAGQLVLPVFRADTPGVYETTLCDLKLRYSYELGLQVIQEEDKE